MNNMSYQERAKYLLTKKILVVPYGTVDEKKKKLFESFVIKINGEYLGGDGKIKKFDTEKEAKEYAKGFKEKLILAANAEV